MRSSYTSSVIAHRSMLRNVRMVCNLQIWQQQGGPWSRLEYQTAARRGIPRKTCLLQRARSRAASAAPWTCRFARWSRRPRQDFVAVRQVGPWSEGESQSWARYWLGPGGQRAGPCRRWHLDLRHHVPRGSHPGACSNRGRSSCLACRIRTKASPPAKARQFSVSVQPLPRAVSGRWYPFPSMLVALAYAAAL